jgi:hypothetical protein
MSTLVLALIAAVAVPASAPAANAESVARAPQEPVPPVPTPVPGAREQHPFVIGAQVGWNTLAGLGLAASWTATRHLAFDAGAGYVISVPKAGARLRWNLLTSDVTPFVAAGGFWSFGRSTPQTITEKDGDSFAFQVGPAGYAQAVAGVDVQDASRFTFRFELGWSKDLTHRDLRVLSGTPDATSWKEVRLLAGDGLVLGGSFGYAF